MDRETVYLQLVKYNLRRNVLLICLVGIYRGVKLSCSDIPEMPSPETIFMQSKGISSCAVYEIGQFLGHIRSLQSFIQSFTSYVFKLSLFSVLFCPIILSNIILLPATVFKCLSKMYLFLLRYAYRVMIHTNDFLVLDISSLL